MIKSRYLTYKASFLKPIKTKDDAGQTVTDFAQKFVRYVDLRPVSIESSTESNVEYDVSRLELSTRYSKMLQDTIKPGWKVEINKKAYQIDEIGDLLSRKKLTYIISSYE